MKALLIPVRGDYEVVDLKGGLTELQGLVGGLIQVVPVPENVTDGDHATAYIHEEEKFRPHEVNRRATWFMQPGSHLMAGDYIAGPMLVCGFDVHSGENTDLPDAVERDLRRVEGLA